MDALRPIRQDPRVAKLADLLKHAKTPVTADGLWGSAAPIVAALAAEALERPLLLVTAHTDDADDTRDDVETALGFAPELLPALDQMPGDPPDAETLAERLRLCLRLLESDPDAAPPVIVAPILSLMQPVPSAVAVERHCRVVRVGQPLDQTAFLGWLEEHGFLRCEQVEQPADYATRGGIIDVFAPGRDRPVRIELFGDTIDSIRLFDAGTQRSSQSIEAIRLPAPAIVDGWRSGTPHEDTTSFLALAPADALIAIIEPSETQEIGRTCLQRLGERAGLIPADSLFERFNAFSQLHLARFAAGSDIGLEVGSLPQFEAKTERSFEALAELARECDVVVFCENLGEQQRFRELLDQSPEKLTRVSTFVGALRRGFRWNHTAFVPNHELFQRTRRRTLRRVAPARPIDSFFDLSPGDHVVHVAHGIGRFAGLKTLTRGDQTSEYLEIEFADGATVHTPVSQIHVVQKYIGAAKGKPVLSKLGGSAWKRARDRVADAVTDLAAELLALQAERETEKGVAYPADTLWQAEFEEAFPYTETEDQLRALGEIKNDLTRRRPMDRLICGDVGFGKTELAIRAAFKVVEYGRQVAVLAPTTVLAEQHQVTFRERLADYPFTIESLSRFRTTAEAKRIVKAVGEGRVDILIGTHRILSKDVRFADLGLVIIDEEQRFGVEAKERLKQVRSTVDVLMLSATPIPRTLHMALVGIRDISSLATPPLDRRAIVTQVRLWERMLIRDALLRELNREGQAFFVHNFVHDIHEVANEIRSIVPEARVVVGHGQMKPAELEQVMLQFMRREADVLVSTNIIESGIDNPTANTMIINRADRFGLADLHQLRGRVGRSGRRAYCYLLLTPKRPVKDIAARRLKAIEHYSGLGAGFQIAMRDLEIRGAGNLLGSEQSGHIDAVGYEMYCELLEQAVRRMKDEPAEPWKPVNLELGVSASIPKSYIRADRQRMEVYKRLATTRDIRSLRELTTDLRDAFGPTPPDVETLLTLAEIRVLSQPWGIRSIVSRDPDVVFAIEDLKRAEPLFQSGPGSPRMPDPQTIHWRLPKRFFRPDLLLQTLREQFAQAEAAPMTALAGGSA